MVTVNSNNCEEFYGKLPTTLSKLKSYAGKNILGGLALISIMFSIIFLFPGYGVFSPYNYFTAKQDIKNGNIANDFYGLPNK